MEHRSLYPSYRVSYLMVSRTNGPPLAWKPNAYTTGVLAFASFEPALGTIVSLTGHYADHGVDADGNGLFDSLAVTIGVSVADSGTVWALGRLTDANGIELADASTPVFMPPGTSRTAVLLFDGRHIYAGRTNGP